MKKSSSKSGSSTNTNTTLDRKSIEKNRRMHMKGLCFKLLSLIPRHHISSSKEILTQLDQLDYAAFYIQELKGRIDDLKKRKQLAVMMNSSNSTTTNEVTVSSSSNITSRSSLPILEVRDIGSTLEVTLITGLNKNFMFYEVINVLEEEGAEVVNANFSIVGDKVFHTIHCQARLTRVGVESSRVSDRLKELIC